MNIVVVLAEEFNITKKQVEGVIHLLDEGNTIPFIARYRKEMTGELDEEIIRNLKDRLEYLRNLEARKKEVLRLIEKQGKLTPELADRIKRSRMLQEVEDLYRPFRPKRKTRASKARDRGLEPLARLLLAQERIERSLEDLALPYVNEAKGVKSPEEALQGARDIIAEVVSDNAEIRGMIRQLVWEKGVIHSQKLKDEVSNYSDYYDYSERVKNIPSHRILAINRGEREGFLKVSVVAPETEIINKIENCYMVDAESLTWPQVRKAIHDGYNRLLAPSIEREIRAMLTEKAEERAIKIFGQNLKRLLLQPPVRGKNVLGIDPAYRTGCKLAVVDATGKLLDTGVVYPTPPQEDKENAHRILKDLIKKHSVSLIAIGNGTASRETELFVSELISKLEEVVYYVIVNEAGASVYSASRIAKKEFPYLDVSYRGAVSIARRVLDPLAELVKIDPKSIGVGQYQHDVNQKKLGETLDGVVESCVNTVGVDLNTASSSLLKYVAGISSKVAENIIKFREEKGKFTSRNQLLQVTGLGEKTFTQCAGFLRIPDAEHPFDNTPIHPESYGIAERILVEAGFDVKDLKERPQQVREAVKGLDPQNLAERLNAGIPTIKDILKAFQQPGRDPREDMPKPVFMKNVLRLEDLKQGMLLKGTVRNVVDFGVFVDIGVGRDGLVHISQLSEKYIKHPFDVVSIGDHVTVKVLEVDMDRERISLSMKGVS